MAVFRVECGANGVAHLVMDDPSRKLNLTALMEGKASEPPLWPEPFTDDGDQRRPRLIDMGKGHFVRAHELPAKLKVA